MNEQALLNKLEGKGRGSTRHLARALPTAHRPRRKVSAAKGAVTEELKTLAKLSAKPAPPKVEKKPKMAAGKVKSSDKRVKQKGRREQRENR